MNLKFQNYDLKHLLRLHLLFLKTRMNLKYLSFC
jgi:hypothetical protein